MYTSREECDTIPYWSMAKLVLKYVKNVNISVFGKIKHLVDNK